MRRRKLTFLRSIPSYRLKRAAARLGRFLLKSKILPLFAGLCLLGLVVGLQTRPARSTFPYAELFEQMSVVSFRDSPTDTATRFVVELAAGGKVFREYDIEKREFLPPSGGRSYGRTITGTHYVPLRVRGHVGFGVWLDVPRSSRRLLLPSQLEELYRTTLGFVRPISQVTGILGILSGYSMGYRVGTWNSSLRSRSVQERVLATPDLGRTIAREAWRRVLLEPLVMTGEEDAARFAAVTGTQRLYANFFRVALDDSDGFVPREAARLAGLGRVQESRAMLAFAAAVRRAAIDSVHLANTDFEAIEQWATLLDRRGHWVHGAIPPPGEERIKLLGALAWYGLAPTAPHVDRVWVGPRMLVRVGDAEGFVADEVPETGVGCPVSWRARLREVRSGASANASAWIADRPEFAALFEFGRRVAHGLGRVQRQLAALRGVVRDGSADPASASRGRASARFASRTPGAAVPDSAWLRSIAQTFASPRGEARVWLLATDSSGSASLVRAARAAVAGVDSLMGDSRSTADVAQRFAAALERVRGPRTGPDTAATQSDHAGFDLAAMVRGRAVDAMAESLEARGVRDALLELAGTARALGLAAAGDPWSVPIADPRGRIPVIGRLRLLPGQGISCSGRHVPAVVAAGGTPGSHADPGGARLTGGLVGFAALSSDATTAAAWHTTLLVHGPREARQKSRERPDLSAILIEPGADGTDIVWVESDLKDRFVLDGAAQALFRVEYF